MAKRAWYLPDKYPETRKDRPNSNWSAWLIIIWHDDGGMWRNDDMTNWSRWSLSYFGIRRNVVSVLSSNHFSLQHLNNHLTNHLLLFPNMPMLNSRTFQSASGVNTITRPVSRIQILTSKITQVCQDIHDIKLRRLLITQVDKEPNDITNSILTNQSDHKNTWGSDRSKPDPPDIHEDHAEDGNNYVYRTPNLLEHNTQNNQEDHGRCPLQLRPKPSGMTPEPLPCPDPSEASETSSSLLTSLSSPPKKDDIELVASLMYTERPDLSWSLCLAPAKKNGGVKPAEESEMREGTGLMRAEASPCREFGGGTGIGAARLDRTDSETEPPLSATASALWHEGQVKLWRSMRIAWAGTQCSMIKWLKEAATFSKATNRDSTPSIWEETKAWLPQISWTLFFTNSISGVDPMSSDGWGQLSSA